MNAILTVLLSSLSSVFVKMMMSMLTEKMIAKLAFTGLDYIGKKTTNTIDDEIISELKESYYGKEDKK